MRNQINNIGMSKNEIILFFTRIKKWEYGEIGRHSRLLNWVPQLEMIECKVLKVGEHFKMSTPSQANRNIGRCRDLTGTT